MKKLSKIDESTWGDMRKRSSGDVVRQENAFNPDYVDFGEDTTVYWAVENLIIDGCSKLYFDEVKDYNNNGWRLPTVEEVKQVNWKEIRKSWYDGGWHIKFPDGNELKLITNGESGFHMWTSETNKKFPTAAWSYGFDNMSKFDIEAFNKRFNRLYVFLVKDKHHINESTWGDMRKRSSGEKIRQEDVFTFNIDKMKPVDLGKDFPVYWADIDLEANGEDKFNWEETEKMIPQIEKTGWRLPKAPNEIYDMFGKDINKRNSYLHRTWWPKQQGIISSEETNQYLIFPTTNQYCESYWCTDDWEYNSPSGRVNFENERCFDVGMNSYYESKFALIRTNNMEKTKKIKIRLVKDK